MVYNVSKSTLLKGSLMKKLLVLLGAVILSSGISFAAIGENETTDIDYLRSLGYSESALQIVDTAKYHGSHGKPRYYQRNVNNGKKLGKAYTVVKYWFDPAQDDGLFGEHQINFSNSWTWEKNKYSSRYKPAKGVENL